MLRRLIGIVAAAAALISGPADAQMTGVLGGGLSATAGSYTGPGDVVSGWSAWYSCARAYNAAYATSTGNLCNLRNTSTNETCDEPTTTAGAPGVMKNCTSTSNGLSLSTFCTLGCAVTEMYDQTGGTHHMLQATAGDQPTLTVSCLDTLPCTVWTSASITLAASANFTPVTGAVSFIAVADRISGTGGVRQADENGTNNRMHSNTSASSILLTGGGGSSITATASDNAWHAIPGVVAGAGSVINIDGVETTGTASGNTTAGAPSLAGAASTTMDLTETGFIDNVSLTGTQRTNLCRNMQAAYGGGGNFGATC
jgi:hypothetical protein